MNVFWRRVGIMAAAATAVVGVLPGTAQADTRVHFTCEYVSPVFYNPLSSSWAYATGCVGPAGTHTHVYFDKTSPASAMACFTAGASLRPDGKVNVTGWDCV